MDSKYRQVTSLATLRQRIARTTTQVAFWLKLFKNKLKIFDFFVISIIIKDYMFIYHLLPPLEYSA